MGLHAQKSEVLGRKSAGCERRFAWRLAHERGCLEPRRGGAGIFSADAYLLTRSGLQTQKKKRVDERSSQNPLARSAARGVEAHAGRRCRAKIAQGFDSWVEKRQSHSEMILYAP